MKLILATAVLCALGAIASPAPGLAPLLNSKAAARDADDCMVVLKADNKPASLLSALSLYNGTTAIWEHALKGFSGKFDAATVKLIRASPTVAYVERDSTMAITSIQSPAPYNLAICSMSSKLSGPDQNKYYYRWTGQGVKAYVIDTGINVAHRDFGGRAIMGYNNAGGSNGDDNGHGTHIAGIIGGTIYGVAKQVTLVGVKVLDASGSTSTSKVVDGINWAVKNCNGGRCIINLSVGGSFSQVLNNAVDGAYNSGLLTTVAAGNENYDACKNSPASAKTAMVASSIDSTYARTSSANYGSCVDIFAPGINIISDWIGSNTATNTISGTSLAAPHIAGLGAYFLSIQARSPADLAAFIIQNAYKGAVTNPGSGSPNLIGNNGYWNGV